MSDEPINSKEDFDKLFKNSGMDAITNNNLLDTVIKESLNAAVNIIGGDVKPEDILNISLKFKFKNDNAIDEYTANLDFKKENYSTLYKPDINRKKTATNNTDKKDE